MRRLAALVVAAAVVLGAPAGAQDAATDRDRLVALGLPVQDRPVPVHYSRWASDAASTYAHALNEAAAWYRAELGWDGPMTMAVLDAADYARVTTIPYPVPYAERDTGLVVMPDDISSFPGFDAWGIEAVALNANLTFHEIGHIIAWQTGVWSGSYWVNELVADVFLAAYLRANKPDDRTLLEGVPPAFADAGVITSLSELDRLYAGVGLANYAWFQFRLAAMADHMVADGDFAALIDALRVAFPKDEYVAGAPAPSTEVALARLEAISPGVAAMARDMVP